MNVKSWIRSGRAVLGCELGSTRIKATLVTPEGQALAAGAFSWENQLREGVWTYDMNAVLDGLAASFAALQQNIRQQHDIELTQFGALGISAMMHGYIATDARGELLVPFRTWRNNFTHDAATELTGLFDWPIPQRWSIAHLYHAMNSGESHIRDIAHITTLAGWVHWKLTGQWAIGVGDASGMFPVDPATSQWDTRMLSQFDDHVAAQEPGWRLASILPSIIPVGEIAGTLSERGAALLDPAGGLQAGAPVAPPEGDAQTGMVVTNSVRPRTGNVSAGTSVFAMLVLEERLSSVHPEIDLVLTPDGELVGMAHSNNCSSDFDAWVGLLGEAAALLGAEVDDDVLFARLMPLALQGDANAGGLLAFGYVSGEHMTGFSEGRPLFVRGTGARFTLANFIRAHLFSALCALRTGMNVLTEKEGVKVEELRGHGGFFKTADVGQRIMAAATGTPVSLPETAGEGGAWGMALLAAYMLRAERDQALPDFLDQLIGDAIGPAFAPDADDVAGFDAYFQQHTAALAVEAAAVEHVG